MRVAAAIVSGASASAAAGRFRASVSTAIRWAKRLHAERHARARAMGGDDRSRLIEPIRSETALVAKIARVRHGHRLALIAALLHVASCSSIGPGSVRRDRVDYVGAVADSWKHQTLLNIVRLRYGDAPVFLDVSSLISSYTVQNSLMINGEVITDTTGSFVNPGAATSYTDKPTISYTPLSGDKFDKSLLRPLTPGTIFALIQAGYPADFVLWVTVRSINGIYNRASEGVQVRPADPEFYPLIEAIRRIQRTGALGLRVVKREPEEITLVSFPSRHPTPEMQRDVQFVYDTLKLKPEGGEIVLSFGATQSAPNEIAILSRSMVEILGQIAAGIEVPLQDVTDGRTLASFDVPQASAPEDRPIVAVHSAAVRSGSAYAAVQYHGTWYWIDDRDFAAKRAFTFLMLFFALAGTGVPGQVPVLTIPAS